MNAMIFIIGLLLFAAGVVVAIIKARTSENPSYVVSIILIALSVLVILLSFCFVTIPTGYTGVKSTFGQIHEKTLPNGMNFRVPFVQSIEKVNNKQQDISLNEEIWGETQEKVQVYMSGITITYQINPEKSAWIYANVSNYKDNLITYSLVSSALKNSTASLAADKATIRSEVEPLAQQNLQSILDEKYGENVIFIHKVVISNMNFENSYNQAISQRNMAELTQQRQSIENQTAIEKAEADKKVQVTAAQAKAEVMITQATAEKEANELRNASLTDRILYTQWISKWDGKLPTVSSDSTGFMINLENLSKTE